MVLANTLGDSPRNYGNRPVNTLNEMLDITSYRCLNSDSCIHCPAKNIRTADL